MDEPRDMDDSSIETLPALKTAAKSVEQLCAAWLPTLAARIWTTCCWSDDWKIGDFRFMVVSFEPERGTQLYVQFWSEPHEPVLIEVCSGEWAPPALKYVQARQRRLLRSLGYEKRGEARNFGKHTDVDSADAAERVAREALRILFDAFGVRGRRPITITMEEGERAEHEPVWSSLTPQDLAKLLSARGYAAHVPETGGGRLVLVERGRERFAAMLDAREGHQNLYRAIVLIARLEPRHPVSDDVLVHLGDETAGLTVRLDADGALQVSTLLLMAGGVTEAWILSSIEYWRTSVRRCERLIRKVTQGRSAQPFTGACTIH